MNNTNEKNIDEIKLPRISNLIPKSPETKKREQESDRLLEKFFNDKNLELLYSIYILRQIWEKFQNHGEHTSELRRNKTTATNNAKL